MLKDPSDSTYLQLFNEVYNGLFALESARIYNMKLSLDIFNDNGHIEEANDALASIASFMIDLADEAAKISLKLIENSNIIIV